jgi:hypothetical protein
MIKTLVIKRENSNKGLSIDYDRLDFGLGIGDYYYNGKCSGSQIGFCWNEELGYENIDHLYFVVYCGDEYNNDLYGLNTTLKNLTPQEKLYITLNKEDYEIFKKWVMETERTDFHYYSMEEIAKLEREVR